MKKVMTKITAFSMALVLIFLVGCTADKSAPEKEPEKAQPVGFVDMKLDEVYLSNILDMATKGDRVMIVSGCYVDKEGNPVILDDDSDVSQYTDVTYLLLFDAKKNELIAKKTIEDCPLESIWGCEFDDNDNIVLFDEGNWKNAVYSDDMTLLEMTDREQYDCKKDAEKSPFYNNNGTANKGYWQIESSDKQYMVFTDEPETLYIREGEGINFSYDFYIPEQLVVNENFNDDVDSITYSVEDYKNALLLNSTTIYAKDYGFDYVTTNARTIGDKYLCVIDYFGKDDGNQSHMFKAYTLSYKENPQNEKINVSKTTLDELKSTCDEKIKELADKYNVSVHINEIDEYFAEFTEIDKNEKTDYVTLSENLSIFLDFFDSLPEGMVRECYTDFINSDDNRSGIRIDFVSQITTGVDAFANCDIDPMEMCFTPSTVTTKNVSHEFMHLMDARLDDYMQSSDKYEFGLFAEWDFNDGLENNDPDNEYVYDFDEKQFISDYSAKSDFEDRAEIFSLLYLNDKNATDALKNEVVMKKAKLLFKLIREAFPSCQGAEKLTWEKPLEKYEAK